MAPVCEGPQKTVPVEARVGRDVCMRFKDYTLSIHQAVIDRGQVVSGTES